MAKKRIFVSCGQHTKKEKDFGNDILQFIDRNGMEGFFAEEVHQAADLNTFLLKELQRCDGFLAVLQKRGEVRFEKFDVIHRASVWIQQEIAILFYRSFLLERPIPMRVYQQEGILHEGLTKWSIINPIPFKTKEAVLADLAQWLKGPTFEEQPALARRESMFRSRIQNLEADDWLILELIVAHSAEPGGEVQVAQLGKDYRPVGRSDYIREDLNNRLDNLGSYGLVHKPTGAIVRVNRVWWDLLWNEFRNQGRAG